MVLALKCENGPGPSKGFVPTLKDAKAALSEAWCGRLRGKQLSCGLQDDRRCATWPIGSAGRYGPPSASALKTAAHSADFIVIRPIVATQ